MQDAIARHRITITACARSRIGHARNLSAAIERRKTVPGEWEDRPRWHDPDRGVYCSRPHILQGPRAPHDPSRARERPRHRSDDGARPAVRVPGPRPISHCAGGIDPRELICVQLRTRLRRVCARLRAAGAVGGGATGPAALPPCSMQQKHGMRRTRRVLQHAVRYANYGECRARGWRANDKG